jgi:hypothetical protein
MLCDLSMQCAFYIKQQQTEGLKVDALLMDFYCCGLLHLSCKRKSYEKDNGVSPPDELSPTGQLIRRLN